MHFLPTSMIAHLVTTYGYWLVALVIGLESIGVILPGESALVAASIIAGTSHTLSISMVIASAAAGAIVGDNIGFLLGRTFGHRLLVRYGHYIRITRKRLVLGRYLFFRYGGKVVFFGRFVAVLRSLAAVLAGANYMRWPRFLAANTAGGIAWASVYGLGGYYFGKELNRVAGPLAILLVVGAMIILVACFIFVRGHEAEFNNIAESGPKATSEQGE